MNDLEIGCFCLLMIGGFLSYSTVLYSAITSTFFPSYYYDDQPKRKSTYQKIA
jgi:hypothetical protein